jgi:hypothetical protein
MSTERDQAIDKIKKLLRMKRGGTAAEVETALAMAQKLAANHGIDINSVDPEEKLKSEMGHEDGWLGSRAPYDVQYAVRLVERFFNVDVIYRQGYRHIHKKEDGTTYAYKEDRCVRLAFVGRKFEIEIAIYIFRFLCGHFKRTWNTKRGRCRDRKSFVHGMFLGISNKLEAERPPIPANSQALVLSREAYKAQAFGELTSTKYKSPELSSAALRAGWIEGQRTSIRPAVEAGEPNPKQLAL